MDLIQDLEVRKRLSYLNAKIKELSEQISNGSSGSITIDSTPTSGSTHAVQSGGTYNLLQLKVDKNGTDRLITSTEANKLLNLANVAISGSYVDLTNKPSISGTNTGDETSSSIKSKLGITVLSGSNTGDQDISGIAANTTTISNEIINRTNADALLLVKANNLSDLASASTARTNLSLNNVENTALSTWAGSSNITLAGNLSNISNNVTGTTGSGFIDLIAQSVDPAIPSVSHQHIYADSSGRFAIMGSNGFSAAFTKSALTASRIYTFPDAAGIFILNDNTTTLTNKTIAASNNTISGITNANLSGSAGIADANISSAATWNAKQAALVSGTNIKTINGTSLVGSGDLVISSNPISYTIAQRDAISSPVAGNQIYQSDDGWLEYYDSAWGWMPVYESNAWKIKYGHVWQELMTNTLSMLTMRSTGTGSGTTFQNNTSGGVVLSYTGGMSMNTGSTSTGYTSIYSQGTSGSGAYYIGFGRISHTWFLAFDTLSNTTDEYVYVGGIMSNNITGAVQTDGIFFTYDRAGANNGTTSQTTFQCVTRSASTSTISNSGVTVAISQKYKMNIIIAADRSQAQFYINGTLVATNTTNLPTTTTPMRVVQGIFKSAGTTVGSQMHIWDMMFKEKFTTSR